MKFNSQICTTHSQSEQLLALGLKAETADMMYQNYRGYCIGYGYDKYPKCITDLNTLRDVDIPAWSLHRLITMLSKEIFHQSKQWHLFLSLCFEDAISYEECNSSQPCYLHFCSSDNIYDNVIESIEWLIKEGHFNKEYLKEKIQL